MFRHLLWIILLLPSLPSNAQSPKEKHVNVDFDGDGRADVVMVRRSLNEDFTSLEITLAGQKLRLNGSFQSDGDDGWPELKPVTPLPGRKEQWLMINGILSGWPESTCWLVGVQDGRLKRIAAFKGSTIKVPENGSVMASTWIGFWSRIVKWSVGAEGALQLVPQEFHAVGATKVKVKASFALLSATDSDLVVARPRVGSEVEIVIWKGTLPVHESTQMPPEKMESSFKEATWKHGWYLVKTESGLLGWVSGSKLEELLELPLAG